MKKKQKATAKKKVKSKKARIIMVIGLPALFLLGLFFMLSGVPTTASIVPTNTTIEQKFLFGGDVNDDGTVNIVDTMLIVQYTVKLRQLVPSQLDSADVNKDGNVDIIDAMYIAQYTVGLRQKATNWVTKDYDFNHTGISNSADVLAPTIAWKKVGVVGTFDEWAGVIVVNGIIYTVPMTNETNMYAIYAHNQSTKWSYKIGKTNNPPLYFNRTLYVQNMDGKLFALNEIDGSEKWTKDVPTLFAAGAKTISKKDNAIFVSQGNPLTLYSYDLDSGKEKWNASLPWNEICLRCAITFGTVYNDEIVYVSGYSFHISDAFVAYYSNNGTKKWSISGGTSSYRKVWDSDLLLYNNVLYSGLYYGDVEGSVIAINLDGSIKWKQLINENYVAITPKIYNNILWIISSTTQNILNIRPKLYGLNPNTGKVIYSIGLDDNSFVSSMSPVLGKNYLYFTTTGGSHNKLYAFDYFGNKRWSYDFGSAGLYSQGALVDGTFYLTADDTYLYAFRDI